MFCQNRHTFEPNHEYVKQEMTYFFYTPMTRYNEETLAKLKHGKDDLKLLKVTDGWGRIRYTVRLNRKVQDSNVFEYPMRKLFASIATNIILQLKIY